MKASRIGNIGRAIALSGLSLVLSGCKPQPSETEIEMKKTYAESQPAESQNYIITRVGVFKDDLAYGDKRGIYEIVDNRTGKTYLGVSGIGICEVGSHKAGKTSVADER